MNGPALHKRTATTTKEPRGCHRKVRLRRPHTNYNSRETLRHGLRGLHFPEGLSAPELICRLNLDERHSLLGNVVLEPETILPGPAQLIVPGLLSKYFGYICACVNVWVCSCVCLFVREACWAAGPLHVCLIGGFREEDVQEYGIVLSVCRCLQVEAGGVWPASIFAGKAQVPAPSGARGGRRAVKGFSSPVPSFRGPETCCPFGS